MHRIGRTGRAHAIGDAISFVTHEDVRAISRSLQRFLGRGIPRKKLEGLIVAAQAPRESSRPAVPEAAVVRTAAAATTSVRSSKPADGATRADLIIRFSLFAIRYSQFGTESVFVDA